MIFFAILRVATWLTSSFVSSAAWAQASWHPHLWCAASDASDAASWMQSSEGRDTLAKLHALNVALRSFFIEERCRVEWKSRRGHRSFVLAAFGARSGQWKDLARIDWLRGRFEDDEARAWRERLFQNVHAFQELASDSNLSSRNSRGNVVEACVGASFLAVHELAASRAPAASGATIPRFRFRTKPPEAMAHAAAIFPFFVHLGVSSPALRRPDASERRYGIPGEIKVVEPDAQAGLAAQPRADAWPPRVHTPSPAEPPEPKTPPTLPAVGGHDNEFDAWMCMPCTSPPPPPGLPPPPPGLPLPGQRLLPPPPKPTAEARHLLPERRCPPLLARLQPQHPAAHLQPKHPAAGGQPRGQPPAEPEPAPPRRRTRRRSESRERKGLPRAWSPIRERPGHRAIGGDGAGSQDDAEVQGFHVSFSRHRDLWRGTRASQSEPPSAPWRPKMCR